MDRIEPHYDDRRRVARMVYRPDHFLMVMALVALAILLMAGAFVACMIG